MKLKKIFTALFMLIAIQSLAISQDDWFAVDEEVAEEAESSFHHNHLALFLGAMSNLSNGHASFSAGLDYNYFFVESDPQFGIGLLAEGAFGEHSEYIVGMPLVLLPTHSMKFFIAPSVLFKEEEELDELHETDATKFLLRIGGAYMFHFDNFSLAPTIQADIVGSEVSLVYGLSFGLGF